MVIVSFHAWLFPSMYDYCFLSCMWSQVIDLFPSKQAGIAGMAVCFSIAWGIAWPEGRSDPKKKSHQKFVLLLFFLVVGDDNSRNCLDRSHGFLLPICLDWLPYLLWLIFIGFYFTVDYGMCEECVGAWVGEIQITLAIGSSWSLWKRIRSYRF